MKKNTNKPKEFDAVKFMRDVRAAISEEIEGMNFEQLKEYFAQRRTNLLSDKPNLI